MKNFTRALRDSMRYWKAILLATLCSLVVAALWGGNIGALFPVIQVTMGEESLQHWVETKIATAQEQITELSSEILTLERQLSKVEGEERYTIERQISQLRAEKGNQEASVRSSRRIQPWIERFVPSDPFQTVVLVIVLVIIGTFVKHLFILLNTMIVARISADLCRGIRLQVFERAMTIDRVGFAKYGISGFTTHITATTDMLAGGILNLYGGAVREPLKILACLAGACYISWRLLLISLIIAPLVTYLIVWLSKRIKSVCRRTLAKAQNFQHVMLEALGSIQTVQAYGMEGTEQKRFDATTLDLVRLTIKGAFYNALSRPITELLGIGMVGTTVVIGAYLVLNHETHLMGIRITNTPLSVSTMMLFFGLLIGASDPVRKLSAVFSSINTGIAAADILYPLLDGETQITSPAHPQKVARPHHLLELQGLSFAYQGDNYVLRDINLKIEHGEKIALIGANGSGKSSLVHLICRFYDPQHGAIKLDGVNLRDIALEDLRSRIGLVIQQTELFHDTIMYNIRYGSLDATDKQVQRAAELAHAQEFINALPDKYDTMVGPRGQRLSGGQRQRIALARAILRDPEILILDEATSQIDTESEKLINEVLTEFSKNRTLIMITHRLNNLCLADRVYELDAGRMVESDCKERQVA